MTYAYDPEIAPWLSMLPNGSFTVTAMRALGEAAVRSSLVGAENLCHLG